MRSSFSRGLIGLGLVLAAGIAPAGAITAQGGDIYLIQRFYDGGNLQNQVAEFVEYCDGSSTYTGAQATPHYTEQYFTCP